MPVVQVSAAVGTLRKREPPSFSSDPLWTAFLSDSKTMK